MQNHALPHVMAHSNCLASAPPKQHPFSCLAIAVAKLPSVSAPTEMSHSKIGGQHLVVPARHLDRLQQIQSWAKTCAPWPTSQQSYPRRQCALSEMPPPITPLNCPVRSQDHKPLAPHTVALALINPARRGCVHQRISNIVWATMWPSTSLSEPQPVCQVSLAHTARSHRHSA